LQKEFIYHTGWPPVLESTGSTGKYWKQKLVLENTGKNSAFSYPVLESTGFLIPLAELIFFACT
jgi:hypothetical protein